MIRSSKTRRELQPRRERKRERRDSNKVAKSSRLRPLVLLLLPLRPPYLCLHPKPWIAALLHLPTVSSLLRRFSLLQVVALPASGRRWTRWTSHHLGAKPAEAQHHHQRQKDSQAAGQHHSNRHKAKHTTWILLQVCLGGPTWYHHHLHQQALVQHARCTSGTQHMSPVTRHTHTDPRTKVLTTGPHEEAGHQDPHLPFHTRRLQCLGHRLHHGSRRMLLQVVHPTQATLHSGARLTVTNGCTIKRPTAS